MGKAVDTHRSYYLAHRQDDFAAAPADARALESYEILYAAPANDNSPTKARLSARCWNLFRRLVAVHGSAALLGLKMSERSWAVFFCSCDDATNMGFGRREEFREGIPEGIPRAHARTPGRDWLQA